MITASAARVRDRVGDRGELVVQHDHVRRPLGDRRRARERHRHLRLRERRRRSISSPTIATIAPARCSASTSARSASGVRSPHDAPMARGRAYAAALADRSPDSTDVRTPIAASRAAASRASGRSESPSASAARKPEPSPIATTVASSPASRTNRSNAGGGPPAIPATNDARPTRTRRPSTVASTPAPATVATSAAARPPCGRRSRGRSDVRSPPRPPRRARARPAGPVDPAALLDREQADAARRERSGLVEDQMRRARQRLQSASARARTRRRGVPAPRPASRAPTASESAQGHETTSSEKVTARARDDDQTARRSPRPPAGRRRIPTPRGREPRDPRPRRRGAVDQADHRGELGGVVLIRVDPYDQRPVAGRRSGEHPVACPARPRPALAGQHRLLDQRLALDDRPVGRHDRSGPDEDHVARRESSPRRRSRSRRRPDAARRSPEGPARGALDRVARARPVHEFHVARENHQRDEHRHRIVVDRTAGDERHLHVLAPRSRREPERDRHTPSTSRRSARSRHAPAKNGQPA